jgi:hypothetical protein
MRECTRLDIFPDIHTAIFFSDPVYPTHHLLSITPQFWPHNLHHTPFYLFCLPAILDKLPVSSFHSNNHPPHLSPTKEQSHLRSKNPSPIQHPFATKVSAIQSRSISRLASTYPHHNTVLGTGGAPDKPLSHLFKPTYSILLPFGHLVDASSVLQFYHNGTLGIM